MILRNPAGWLIDFSFEPQPNLLPIGILVKGPDIFDRGMIVAYNGDQHSPYCPTSKYPYIVLWEKGYFDVSNAALQVIE